MIVTLSDRKICYAASAFVEIITEKHNYESNKKSSKTLFLHRRLHTTRAHVARGANRVTGLAELGEVLRLERLLHRAHAPTARGFRRF